MNPHEQQYFNLLLAMAVDRFSERIIQRNEGMQNALERLRANPQGEGIWLNEFVDAFFRDALLDNPAGSCLILQALANQYINVFSNIAGRVTVGEMLQEMAKQTFAALLHRKTEEALEQLLAFGGE
ncbi:hypothetical protein [Parageobacillus thermoglucosidasius]|uniref:hypothetical protein n=1 Tax=Parageobacillus thermoglucosidasius TaxID=1426 RepID=UPI0001D17319|nr:hypothetical protein [Parageobacillus thermoglucosidasius]KYD17014.1 hypothetical protein B4168_1414 [Anoxybacillus flavithermus]REK54209.1 MAG: hypothetical protein C6P36_15065 [Geobacillus sp.]AEH48035.1 hypothetical protein Geoth_2100 [Parageobacillus thermoglucosidasius C56-YS93]EID44100.1 hypothetical protein GT20_1821 [Parageobacillus thermoglucosidasius TNO-09.020]MBY6266896.1 hypothetical protein [Parageobacillus thermoglucosidasius]